MLFFFIYHLHSSQCRSKTDWKIAMLMTEDLIIIMPTHLIKIWWASVQ